MKLLVLLLLLVVAQPLPAQKRLPVIRSTSPIVDIRDGADFRKGVWTINPDLKPDLYQTHSRAVTFITDIDSVSFNVQPDHEYDFIILLNGTDSAFTRIVYKPGYLDILKRASEYNYNDRRTITPFTYMPMDDSILVNIRMDFNLDSIAGTGNEISQILSLLHWVHNTFPHDGTKEIPPYTSISDLMSRCIRDRGTLHCGALASVQNSCYLALGFRSRRVVCLPEDSTDMDCHSIVTVFSRTMKKWLWIDPTNDAYVMNEKGELLSIAEVRERLVGDLPLILNPEANWNHRSSITKEEYLYSYMAKNLYAFQCYVTGGGESTSNLLLPVDYKGIIPRTRENNPKCTNNPDLFWEKPE
jgi:hypothetical protein